MEHLTGSFAQLLRAFEPVFTAPSFALFQTLMTGWVLTVRHHYITELIFGGDKVGVGHWSRFHRFFSHNVWILDELCLILFRLLLAAFAPAGTIVLALDDTLCRKRGLGIFGTGMHHDPLFSSKALKLVSWGHNWVLLGLVVRSPFWALTKVFTLPFGFRLYRNRQGNNKGKKKAVDSATRATSGNAASKSSAKSSAKSRLRADGSLHQTRPELALELLRWIADAFPDRTFVVTADSLYGGQSILAHLPVNVHLISRVHPGGALYAPAPKPTAGLRIRGRKPRKGARLSSMQEWADDATPWMPLTFDQYGVHAQLLDQDATSASITRPDANAS